MASIADARKISAEEILKLSGHGLGAVGVPGWPIFDGYVILGDQYQLYEAGHYNGTPVLIGTNSDEGAVFVPLSRPPPTCPEFDPATESMPIRFWPPILVGSDAEALRSARDTALDMTFACPTWAWARLQSRTGKGKVYVYYFSHRPPYPDAPQYKTGARPTGRAAQSYRIGCGRWAVGAIARELDVNRNTVILWRCRFQAEGLDSLWEVAPGRGRKPTHGPEKVEAIVDATLRTKPKGMTQWSCRLMAASQGVSKSTLNNIWQSHNLKPHRVKTFKLSRDAKFLEKLPDVVGLYLNPPQQAMVMCVDEKSQIVRRDKPAWNRG